MGWKNCLKKIYSLLLIILGLLSIFYDGILILLNPGTFLDNVFSFTHIWIILGILLIFAGIFRLRYGVSFFKKMKPIPRLTTVSLFTIIGIISVINLIFILTPKTVGYEEDSEQLILLGGGIDKDGNLPSSVQSRVDVAAKYLLTHEDVICVVTGGTLMWLPYPEAPAIKKSLIEKGIAPERIFLEDKAKDTIENLKFSCAVLSDVRGISAEEVLKSKTVIVTSRFHLRRAERIAKRLGYKNIYGLPAKCPAVYILHDYVREICAYVKLNLRILFTGEPSEYKIFS